MISCDYFEENYEAWKGKSLSAEDSDSMQSHASSCLHCAAVDDGAIRLRNLLSGLPQHEPAVGFEARLNRRISDIKHGKASPSRRRSSLVPGWAAMGAGIATGLAIGVALLIPHQTMDIPVSQFADNIAETIRTDEVQPVLAAEIDSTADSTTVTDSHYNLDRHSQTVSSDR